MQGTMLGARMARKTTHGLDGQHQDEDGDKWRKYVHGEANHRTEHG